MSSAVMTHAQGITQPLEGLHRHFSQLAAKHRDANDQLRSHANDLLSSGASDQFMGAGASAFSDRVSYYIDTSEKHMQALDSATNAVHTCHSSVTDATNTASSAGLHDGLTHKVLTKVSHDEIIQHGEGSIQLVIGGMLTTLNDMANTAGDFFGHLFTLHFGDALGYLGQEFSNSKQLVSDVTGMLQDIGSVLGQWASTICDAVGKCLGSMSSALGDVADFNIGFSGSINAVQTQPAIPLKPPPKRKPPPKSSSMTDDLSLSIGGQHFTLNELKNNLGARLEFLKAFYNTYAPGYGKAEIDFFNFLVVSGRLDKKGGYWDDGDFALMQDKFLAVYDMQNGRKAQNPQVNLWLTFMHNPDNNTWWAAHNATIDAADRRAHTKGTFAKESQSEQAFISNTLVALHTLQSASETGIGNPLEQVVRDLIGPQSPLLPDISSILGERGRM